MALYFYFNETTGDLVYSDQATYDVDGYTSLGQQTNTNPTTRTNWIFEPKRANIKTVTKDPNISAQIDILTSMTSMFYACHNLISVDLSNFDTSNVTDMNRMFSNCIALRIIDISPNMSNILSKLLEDIYYDAFTRQSYAKADIPGGSTYVRDLADLDLMVTMVQSRAGIKAMEHRVNSHIGWLQKQLDSLTV